MSRRGRLPLVNIPERCFTCGHDKPHDVPPIQLCRVKGCGCDGPRPTRCEKCGLEGTAFETGRQCCGGDYGMGSCSGTMRPVSQLDGLRPDPEPDLDWAHEFGVALVQSGLDTPGAARVLHTSTGTINRWRGGHSIPTPESRPGILELLRRKRCPRCTHDEAEGCGCPDLEPTPTATYPTYVHVIANQYGLRNAIDLVDRLKEAGFDAITSKARITGFLDGIAATLADDYGIEMEHSYPKVAAFRPLPAQPEPEAPEAPEWSGWLTVEGLPTGDQRETVLTLGPFEPGQILVIPPHMIDQIDELGDALVKHVPAEALPLILASYPEQVQVLTDHATRLLVELTASDPCTYTETARLDRDLNVTALCRHCHASAATTVVCGVTGGKGIVPLGTTPDIGFELEHDESCLWRRAKELTNG